MQIVSHLSACEREVLGYIGALYTPSEVAKLMHRSTETVRFHLKSIRRKLEIPKGRGNGRVTMAVIAVVYGLAHPAVRGSGGRQAGSAPHVRGTARGSR